MIRQSFWTGSCSINVQLAPDLEVVEACRLEKLECPDVNE